MKVLMVSRFFPAGHPKAGEQTEFIERIFVSWKKHTIRENAKGHFKDGDEVSLRYWAGKPYRSKQVKFSQGTIHIEPVRIVLSANGICATVNNKRINHYELAHNDGLRMADFRNWFFPGGKFGEFRGDILHFSEGRYAPGAGITGRLEILPHPKNNKSASDALHRNELAKRQRNADRIR